MGFVLWQFRRMVGCSPYLERRRCCQPGEKIDPDVIREAISNGFVSTRGLWTEPAVRGHALGFSCTALQLGTERATQTLESWHSGNLQDGEAKAASKAVVAA